MPDQRKPTAPVTPLFLCRFQVDEKAPFKRHLNRLEVEIGKEDFSRMMAVEALDSCPDETFFSGLLDMTGRLLESSQNDYNCRLLRRRNIRVYCDRRRYLVYYRLPERCLRFVPTWRNHVLRLFFGEIPLADTPWTHCGRILPAFRCRYLADRAGGALLLQRVDAASQLPMLTVSHGLYDPQTFEIALYLLRRGNSRAALINLGFSGREPLTDDNLQKLKAWGVPLNPTNVDVIYPYINESGHYNCYKHEESLCRYLAQLEGPEPELIIDVHGYVGTHAADERILVGMGGQSPYPQLAELGEVEEHESVVSLVPNQRFQRGLRIVRELSPEIYVQLCLSARRCGHFNCPDCLRLVGRLFDPAQEVINMVSGEERGMLSRDNIRWLPSAGANALQRLQACRLRSRALCLHVEIPTAVRRRIAARLKRELDDSAAVVQL